MALAKEKKLDLVEVAPDARPPVCKILDYGKHKYLTKKKEHDARKKQHQVVVKEVRVRPKIDEHDLHTKMRKA
ncbi:MAG: translation initiation factor IF-3, partial [Pseudohongiellaceae bacterium]